MKNRYSIFSVLLFSWLLGACDLVGNIDDIEPHYKQETDNVMRDSATAMALVKDVYRCWRTTNISDAQINLSLAAGSLYSPTTASSLNGSYFQRNSVTEDLSILGALYTDLYKVINEANNVIGLLNQGKAAGLSDSGKKRMIGECCFHRALAHFYLLRHFGEFADTTSPYGVVIRDEAYPDHIVVQPRSTVEDSYKFILEDLDYAIGNGPERVAGNVHYSVSRYVAKAFKAKVLLCMGNYKAAEQLAATVVGEAGSNGYENEENYGDIFVNTYESKEVLWALYVFGSSAESLSRMYNGTTYGDYTELISRDPACTRFNIDDTTGGDGYDGRFYFAYSLKAPKLIGKDDGEIQPLPDVVGGGGESAGRAARAINKYPYSISSTMRGNTYYFLRLAELYYIQAESAARNNHPDVARSALKTITGRCGRDGMEAEIDGLADSGLPEYIRRQKWIELFAENGEEWFDLVRYYYAGDLSLTDLTKIKSTLTSAKQLLLPIPQSALAGNNLLVQNP